MSDLGSSNYSETDASNTAAVPNGWPEGMQPSGVNNSARANMGAEKRFWNRINAVKTTAGTTSAYTLTYDAAAAEYYDGEIHSFVVNATNAAAATLNINGIGARQLRLFGGNLLAGALLANQIVQVRYNLSDTAFDIIPQNGRVRLGEQDPSAVATVDLTGIPAGVNHLQLLMDVQPGTTGVGFNLQSYGADGVLDTGATDYGEVGLLMSISSAASFGTNGSSIRLIGADTVSTSAAVGFGCEITAANIQAALYTKFICRGGYWNGTSNNTFTSVGMRNEADRITGLRVLSSVTFTGKITLFGSA